MSADGEGASLDGIKQGGAIARAGVSKLYRAYEKRLLGFFLRHRVSREQAEDLVQETFVNIVRHCGEYRGDGPVSAWVWRIARNALTDHFRRQRPEQAVEDDDLIFLAGGAPDPEIEAVSGFRDCVRKAFAAFGEAFRARAEVLMLVAVEGWDMKELATMLGRTEGATREYVSQCRQKARPFFEPCL